MTGERCAACGEPGHYSDPGKPHWPCINALRARAEKAELLALAGEEWSLLEPIIAAFRDGMTALQAAEARTEKAERERDELLADEHMGYEALETERDALRARAEKAERERDEARDPTPPGSETKRWRLIAADYQALFENLGLERASLLRVLEAAKAQDAILSDLDPTRENFERWMVEVERLRVAIAEHERKGAG